VLAAFTLARSARACEPVHVRSEPEELPPAWAAAARSIARATATEGQPWSCVSATLVIVVAADGVRLRVFRDGARLYDRAIEDPDDLEATAKAVLATISTPAPPPSKSTPPPPPTDAESELLRPPRAFIDLVVGARVEAPTPAVWGAVSLRVLAPVGGFRLGAGARFGAPMALLSHHDTSLMMSGFDAMALVEREFFSGPTKLGLMVVPSICVVSMEVGEDPNEINGQKVEGRFGVGAFVARRLSNAFRLRGEIEGELSSTSFLGADVVAPGTPHVPSWGVGLAFGVEAIAR
jgi:hypothetical protein